MQRVPEKLVGFQEARWMTWLGIEATAGVRLIQ